MGISLEESHRFRKLIEHTSGIFSVIKGIYCPIGLVESVPACAEYPGLPEWGIVGQQKPRIAHLPGGIDKPERNKILIGKMDAICLFEILTES